MDYETFMKTEASNSRMRFIDMQYRESFTAILKEPTDQLVKAVQNRVFDDSGCHMTLEEVEQLIKKSQIELRPF